MVVWSFTFKYFLLTLFISYQDITRFYAGNIELPAYLENLMQRIGIGCRNGDCLSQFFQRAHNCYSEISQALSRLQSNAAITVDSFRGLVRCDSNLDTTYITNISATLLSRVSKKDLFI